VATSGVEPEIRMVEVADVQAAERVRFSVHLCPR
jgi:hypothetical protein